MKWNISLQRYTVFSPKIENRNTIGGSQKTVGHLIGNKVISPSPVFLRVVWSEKGSALE